MEINCMNEPYHLHKKVCSICKEEKDVSLFYHDKQQRDTFRSNCKKCYREVTFRKTYLKNKDKMYHKCRKWKFNNKLSTLLYNLKQVCYNSKNKHYYRYEGIEVLVTLDDLKELFNEYRAYTFVRPKLQRIDPTGHFEMGNLRFIELKTKVHIRRKNEVVSNG